MSVEYALQVAMYQALTADAALTATATGGVYDRVKPAQARPYVHLAQFQAVSEDEDCIEAWEVTADLDVWSDAVGKPEAARIAGLVRDVLHKAELSLPEPYALVEIRHRDTSIADSGNGLTTRARLSFTALIERV